MATNVQLSASFEKALASQGDQPVSAWQIVRSLLELHGEYGDRRGEKIARSPGPGRGETRSAQEWVAALAELYDPAQVSRINGRLAIWGLGQLDPALGDYLQRHDFLIPLEREISSEIGQEPQALIRPNFSHEQVTVEQAESKDSEAPERLDVRQQRVVAPEDDDHFDAGQSFANVGTEDYVQSNVAPDGEESATVREGERLESEEQAPYLPPVPGYISDAVSDRLELDDHLGIAREVETIAHVMTSEKVYPPLSLGLFGDWGSGKSFFMTMLRRQVAGITAYYREREREEKNGSARAWCTRVVQIDFNAWHYADANLWASLVTRIYDALYTELKEGESTDEETRRLLREKVQRAEDEVEAAEAHVEAAKVRVREAESDLQDARYKRTRQESVLGGLLGDVQYLLKPSVPPAGAEEDQTLREKREALYGELELAATRLGYPEAAETYDALLQLNSDLRTFSQRLLALLVYVARSPLALVVLALIMILPSLVEWAGTALALEWSGLEARIVELSALLLPLVGWAKVVVGRGLAAIDTIQSGLEEVQASRVERIETSAQVRAVQQEVAEARAEEVAAESKLENAQSDLKRLQNELEALQPERRLIRLLEERSQTGTYTQHLGLVSLIRSDFERLSQILKELNDEERNLQEQEPPIQRIILYIDDLDRCRPARVVEVLEAVHLLLAFPLFIVVVGVDPRWLRHSLREQYPDNLGENGGSLSDEQATPQQYLEKIFQIPFALRPVGKDGFQEMVGALLSPPPQEGMPAPDEDESPATSGRQRESGEDARNGESDGDLPATGPSDQADDEETVEPQDDVQVVEATTGAIPLQRPLNAEQLTFRPWEEEDVKRLWPLFRTPRTVKRFVNTYRLLRAGLSSPEAVARFEGSEDQPGSYQIAILLLAVVSSYPHLAGRFLTAVDDWLDEKEMEREPAGKGSKELPQVYSWTDVVAALREVKDGAEWQPLLDCLQEFVGNESGGKWQSFTGGSLRKWALRISRYSFALQSSQTLYEQFGLDDSHGERG